MNSELEYSIPVLLLHLGVASSDRGNFITTRARPMEVDVTLGYDHCNITLQLLVRLLYVFLSWNGEMTG